MNGEPVSWNFVTLYIIFCFFECLPHMEKMPWKSVCYRREKALHDPRTAGVPCWYADRNFHREEQRVLIHSCRDLAVFQGQSHLYAHSLTIVNTSGFKTWTTAWIKYVTKPSYFVLKDTVCKTNSFSGCNNLCFYILRGVSRGAHLRLSKELDGWELIYPSWSSTVSLCLVMWAWTDDCYA